MPSLVKITNRQAQVLNVTLRDSKGKHFTKSLLPRSVTSVEASALTESVFDLVKHGHLAVNAVVEKSAPAPAPAPVVASPVLKSGNGNKFKSKSR